MLLWESEFDITKSLMCLQNANLSIFAWYFKIKCVRYCWCWRWLFPLHKEWTYFILKYYARDVRLLKILNVTGFMISLPNVWVSMDGCKHAPIVRALKLASKITRKFLGIASRFKVRPPSWRIKPEILI